MRWRWERRYLIALVAAPFLLILVTMVLYIAFLFIAHGGNRDFLSIDSCLDRGGRWHYEKRVCEDGR